MITKARKTVHNRSCSVHRLMATAVAGVLGFTVAHSAAIGNITASDNASNSAYSGDTWASGSNGGNGFGPWYQGPSGSGVGQSATWGFDTESAANIFGTTASPNIDTSSQSWAIYAFNGSGSDPAAPYAYRGLNSSLGIGATLSLSMATGNMSNPGQEGFQLQNYNSTTGYGTPLFQVAAAGSGTYYAISYGGYTSSSPGFASSILTGIKSIHDGTSSGNNGNGITVAFTLNSPNSFSVTLTPLADPAAAETFSNLALTSLPVNQLFLYNDNLGITSQYVYFNSLQVNSVPETAPVLLMVVGLSMLILCSRNRIKEPARRLNGNWLA